MDLFLIDPVFAQNEDFNNRQQRPKLLIDHKIQDLIISRISLSAVKEGSLLATAMAPQIVIPDRLKESPKRRRKKEILHPLRGVMLEKYVPIGLEACEQGWINALMQLMIFVPNLRSLFAYTPRSLRPFNDFIDRYLADMHAKKALCDAKGRGLIHCLSAAFPQLFCKKAPFVNLHGVIGILEKAACGALRPEWQLMVEGFIPQFDKTEWLIGIESLHHALQLEKQYLLCEARRCFELDAFVEFRPDAIADGSYVAYLKTDEGWMQCIDERVLLLDRKMPLDIPFRRAILLHYRQGPLKKNAPLRG